MLQKMRGAQPTSITGVQGYYSNINNKNKVRTFRFYLGVAINLQTKSIECFYIMSLFSICSLEIYRGFHYYQ